MFSFHKPKIYRSLSGCCICRAKSSSSRFTDSIKYQDQFENCFRITDSREGEICNACVLLVKRWKKLPEGTNRHWHHVVDARAGPGTKSAHKMKNKEKSPMKFKKHKKKIKKESQYLNIPSPTLSDASGNENSNDGSEFPQKRSELSDESDVEERPEQREVSPRPRKRSGSQYVSSFLDLTYWKKTQVCCGTIFKGLNGEVLLDPKLLRPCLSCHPEKNNPTIPSPSSAEIIQRSQSLETESNSSSSGYNDNDFDSKPSVDEDSSSGYSVDNLSQGVSVAEEKFATRFTARALAMEC